MAYCVLQDVLDLISAIEVDTSTLPNETQVGEYIVQRAGEIDSALASRGFVVPITLPVSHGAVYAATEAFLAFLLRLNAKGAAHDVIKQAIPAFVENGGAGAGAAQHAQAMSDSFDAVMLEFQEGRGIPVGLPRYELDLQPRGYLTDIGVWGQPNGSVTDSFGHPIQSEPFVRMGKKF